VRRDWALVTALIFSLLLMLPAASTMAAGESVVAMRPAAGISVTKVSLTSPVKRGAKAQLVIATKAKAKCTIKVTYKSGPSKAKGLEPKTAGSNGRAIWSWTIGTNTTPGKWPIDVKCSLGGKSGKLREYIRVK
jgi:micrococcal nuclease